MRLYFPLTTAAISLALSSVAAHAQDGDVGPWEKFRLSVGGYSTWSDTTIQVNSKAAGLGAIVNLEDTLGVDQSFTTYRVDAGYRFGESRRHEIEFHYFEAQRNGAKILDKTIEIGDTVFPVNTRVDTEFELAFANVDYVYNFLMDDRVRFGASVGVHATRVRLKVDSGDLGVAEDEAFTAPLPMIGLRGEVVLTPKWRLKTDLNAFYLEYDGYRGRLADSYIGVEYLPFKRFGLGAGINSVHFKVSSDGDTAGVKLNGKVEFQLSGFMLYGKYFF